MTQGPRFQLAALFTAMVALGAPWGWVTMDSEGDSRVREENSVLPDLGAPLASLETEALLSQEPEANAVKKVGEADVPQRPHPITPLHEAMSERRELVGAAVAAIQKKEYESARRWLAEADEAEESTSEGADPEEVRGYRLILECLDARAKESELPESLVEESKRYVEARRRAPRREVRRVCLEGRPFARRA